DVARQPAAAAQSAGGVRGAHAGWLAGGRSGRRGNVGSGGAGDVRGVGDPGGHRRRVAGAGVRGSRRAGAARPDAAADVPADGAARHGDLPRGPVSVRRSTGPRPLLTTGGVLHQPPETPRTVCITHSVDGLGPIGPGSPSLSTCVPRSTQRDHSDTCGMTRPNKTKGILEVDSALGAARTVVASYHRGAAVVRSVSSPAGRAAHPPP